MAGEDTRERILDAAERLFALRGISTTSMRALAGAARVNLAAAHYHFGSKEALLDAVVERRARPLNDERVRELDRCEAACDDTPDVERILRCFLMPTVRELAEAPEEKAHLPRLFARVEAQPPEILEVLYRKHFGDVARRFVESLQRALPALPKEVVADRFRLALGAIFCVFSGTSELDVIPGHPPHSLGLEAKLEQVIAFATAGMRAPHRPRRAPGASR